MQPTTRQLEPPVTLFWHHCWTVLAVFGELRQGGIFASSQAAVKSKELVALEQSVAAAAEEVERMELRLMVPAGSELSADELQELRASLAARLRDLEAQTLEKMLAEVRVAVQGGDDTPHVECQRFTPPASAELIGQLIMAGAHAQG